MNKGFAEIIIGVAARVNGYDMADDGIGVPKMPLVHIATLEQASNTDFTKSAGGRMIILDFSL